MLGTIVLNVQYICPQYSVYLSSTLGTLNTSCCFCLLIYLLLPLYSAVLPKPLTMSNSAMVDEVGCFMVTHALVLWFRCIFLILL